ncbi:hypothetical protein VCSRO163_2871 [Vibrio cholerae]|nr:hypothetical protein VCSRO163_2871 [Vibrio cholerae]
MSIKNGIFGVFKILFGSGMSQLLNFTLVVYVTREYGDNELANLVKVIALTSFLILFFEAGCNYLVVSRSKKALKDILIIRFYFIVVVTVIYFSFFDFVGFYFNVNTHVYFLCYFFSLLSSISNFISYYFQGGGNISKYVYSFYGRNSIHFIITIIVLFLFEPNKSAYIWLLVGCMVNFLLLICLVKSLSTDVLKVSIDRNVYTTFKLSFYYLLSSLLIMLMLRSEALLLGDDDDQLALYFQAKTLAMVISLFSASFSNYYLSNIGIVVNKGWYQFRRQVFITYFVALPFLVFILSFSDEIFYYLYSTDKSSELKELFTIVGFAFSLGIITNSLSTIIIKAEVSKFNFYLNFFQVLLVIMGGVVLVNLGWGALGLSIAILMSHIAGFIVTLIYTEINHELLIKKIMEQAKATSTKIKN